MNSTSSEGHRAPDWLHRLVADRVDYEELWGWQVVVLVGQRRLVLQAPGAITVDAATGRAVAAVLPQCGPVLRRADGRWTFLTTAAGMPDGGGGPHADVGTAVVVDLPAPGSATSWVVPPRHRVLPAPAAVLSAVSRMAAPAGRDRRPRSSVS